MKKILIRLLVMQFIMSALFSCGEHPIPNELIEAEKLIQLYPDSALKVLESLSNPESLSEAYYAGYCLLLTEAQDKTSNTFTSDSTIRKALDYYKVNGDPLKLSKAYYYMGRVHQELKDIPYALEYYLKAESSAGDNFENTRLLSRIYNSIGGIYTWLHIYGDAMDAYKKAEHYLYACNDSSGLPFVLRNMARIFHVTDNRDSAVVYYQQAIALSEKVQNKNALVTSLMETAALYIQSGQYDEAGICLSRVSLFMPDNKTDQAALIYAGYYQATGGVDSALYYLDQSVNSENRYTKAASYYKYYQIARNKQDYKQALDYADLYYVHKDTITQDMEREQSLRIQNLYNNQKVLREKEQLQQAHDKKQRQINLLSCILLFSFPLVVLLFLYQRQRRRNETLLRKKQLQQKDELYRNSRGQIEENLAQIAHLKQKLQEAEQKSGSPEEGLIKTRMGLLTQDNVRIELVDESKRLQYEQLISTPVYKKLKSTSSREYMQDDVWAELKTTMDRIYHSFEDKLQSHFPKISSMELKICYLIKSKFTVGEVAVLVALTKSGVSKSRTRLSKKIHGASGSCDDLDRFICNL